VVTRFCHGTMFRSAFGSCRGQDRELQRVGRHALTRSQAGHEVWHLGVGHCGIMAAGEPLPGRQQRLEVTAPARRVLTLAVTLGPGGIEHLLDTRTKPGGGLRYSLPERLQDSAPSRPCSPASAGFPRCIGSGSSPIGSGVFGCAICLPCPPRTHRRTRSKRGEGKRRARRPSLFPSPRGSGERASGAQSAG
jgi:hypothetical protein